VKNNIINVFYTETTSHFSKTKLKYYIKVDGV